MKKHLPLILAAAIMLVVHGIVSFQPLEKWLQVPSGWIAAFLLGAPATFDGVVVHIAVDPLLTVSTACSGARLFSILAGLGGGYWCGRQLSRWLILLPASYMITLFSNSARIAAAWQFRHISNHLIPEWLQEFAHMGIGAVWSLTVIALLVYWITRTAQPAEDPTR